MTERRPPLSTLRPLIAVVLLASIALTLRMAAPILRHPSEQTAGIEFAGRYRDPFVVMHQYGTGVVPAPFLQPATDLPGILLARRTGSIAAYNFVDLLSFPLAALAAALLAWALTRSPLASFAAGLLYAWSPFHVAHAAYHVHIAQVQWLPVTLLAIWLLAARPTAWRLAWATAAGVVMCAASFYWALIAAVIVPVALAAASLVVPLDAGRTRTRAVAFSSMLALLLLASAVAALVTLPRIAPGDPLQYAFTPADQALYVARWTNYLLPPIDHPWLSAIRGAIDGAGSPEQQIGPGWSVLLLASVGVFAAFRRGEMRGVAVWLLVIAALAAACSTNPLARALFAVAPILRAHARFGGVVALCTAVLAGIGLAALWPRARWAAVLLAALAVFELRPYAVRARDVLPTPGYRWLAAQRESRVLDCTSPGREYAASVIPLVDGKAGFREPPFDDCIAPGIGGALARYRYTHLLIRNGSREGRWLSRGGQLPGLSLAASSIDDRVLAVTAVPARVFVNGMTGFHAREFDGAATWRWMPREAEWRVVSMESASVDATVEIHAAAFEGARDLELWIAGARAATARIAASGWYRLGPLTLPPGETPIVLRVPQGDVEAGAVLGNGDARRLAIRFDDWRWDTEPPR